MRNLISKLFICVAAVLALSPLSVSAEPSQIEIQDTLGVTRNVSEVDVAGDVRFDVVDQSNLPANGAEVTLTNAATGEVLTAVAANGVVTFPGVAPGVWVVASTTPSITFTAVSVSSATAVAGAFGGTTLFGMSVPVGIGAGVAGAAALAGGTIAIVEATDDDDDDDDVELSPFS